ncbi:cytochrome c oxidase assembly protein [Brevibacterium yomogidense]|uniref:cytochrome c oxidase assembly protein n=1 Tax=Brevibacterium yomogidense TaxID=946573 RepID=UPI0018DEF00F|nr:cytochrome c oxidase assembly protein [Brevibacterium yomogidense]
MTVSSGHAASPRSGLGRAEVTAVSLAGIVTAVAVVVVTAIFAGPEAYTSIIREYPGTAVSITAAVLRALVEIAGVVTVGSLVLVVIRSRSGNDPHDLPEVRRFAEAAEYGAIGWCLTAGALIVVDGLDTNGLGFGHLLHDGIGDILFWGTQWPAAWMLTALIAGVLMFVLHFATTWSAFAASLWFSQLALLAPVVIGQVLVGPMHDFSVDAGIISTVLAAVLFGTLLVAAGQSRVSGDATTLRALGERRLLWLVPAAVMACEIVTTAVKTQGSGLLDSVTGWQILTRWTAFILAALAIRASARGRTSTAFVLLAAAATVWTGMTAAMTRVPPPSYFVDTTITEIFFGYDVDAAPRLGVLLGHWRINLLFTVIACVAITVYTVGYTTVRRRGDDWPVSRLLCWTAGWMLSVLLLSTGLGRYAPADFGLHMIVHMALNMVVPTFLVLGGPMTLLLRALPGNSPAHRKVRQFLTWPTAKLVYQPLLVFTAYVLSYYGVYLTPLYETLVRTHWGHQLMYLHFVIIGYLFFSLAIGVDRTPRELPHIGRLGLVIAAMPFHAFFGVILMMTEIPVADYFYRSLGLDWLDVGERQEFGGGIAWAGGELPLLAVFLILAVQWTRQDRSHERRFDRHEERGLSHEADAYNEMLQRLADREASMTGRSSGGVAETGDNQ